MISFEKVKSKIDSAEKTLNLCFNMLLDFRKGRGDLGNVLLTFQPTLAECLFELMKTYKELHSEKQELIKNKDTFDSSVFSEIMRENARLLNVIKETIEIGKSFGDAYAWFFFVNNRDELEKHMMHDSTGLFVAGIGGAGEISFIKSQKGIDGLYVIYHGITSILRIGDFSLFDNSKIVGVGELKTKKVTEKEDTIEVRASITSKVKLSPHKGAATPSDEKFLGIQKEYPRLKKQIEIQDSLFNKREPHQSESVGTTYEYDMINRLSRDNRISINSDNSLLLLAQWREEDSLFNRLYNEEIKATVPDSFSAEAQSLLSPNNEINCLCVGIINTDMCQFSIPILWWNIDDEICRDIYLKKVLIYTIYNPGNLLQLFINDGYKIEFEDKSQKYKIQKITGSKMYSVGNIESMFYFITNCLMRTEDVYALAHKAAQYGEKFNEVPVKIQINTRLSSFPKSMNNDE